jgi:hypothetical protein
VRHIVADYVTNEAAREYTARRKQNRRVAWLNALRGAQGQAPVEGSFDIQDRANALSAGEKRAEIKGILDSMGKLEDKQLERDAALAGMVGEGRKGWLDLVKSALGNFERISVAGIEGASALQQAKLREGTDLAQHALELEARGQLQGDQEIQAIAGFGRAAQGVAGDSTQQSTLAEHAAELLSTAQPARRPALEDAMSAHLAEIGIPGGVRGLAQAVGSSPYADSSPSGEGAIETLNEALDITDAQRAQTSQEMTQTSILGMEFLKQVPRHFGANWKSSLGMPEDIVEYLTVLDIENYANPPSMRERRLDLLNSQEVGTRAGEEGTTLRKALRRTLRDQQRQDRGMVAPPMTYQTDTLRKLDAADLDDLPERGEALGSGPAGADRGANAGKNIWAPPDSGGTPGGAAAPPSPEATTAAVEKAPEKTALALQEQGDKGRKLVNRLLRSRLRTKTSLYGDEPASATA